MTRVPTLPAIGLAIVAAVSLIVTLVAPAGAGGIVIRGQVTYLPVFGSGDETVNFSYLSQLECEGDETYAVRSAGLVTEKFNASGDPALDNGAIGLSVNTDDFPTIVVRITDLPGGVYVFERTCDGQVQPLTGTEQDFNSAGVSSQGDVVLFNFFRIELTKDVVTPPDSASFTIDIACDRPESTKQFQQRAVDGPPEDTWTRQFDQTGGTSYVVVYPQQREFSANGLDNGFGPTCTLVESDTGGADDVTVDPTAPEGFEPTAPGTEISFNGPSDEPVTFTNTFVAPEPTPSPTPEPSPSPTPEVANTVEEAEPAEAVEAEADFTG